MKQHRKRAVPAGLIVLEVILIVLFLFLCAWWYGYAYPVFENVATAGVRVPGLASGISPQGLCALPESSGYDFAMSGYIAGEASRVYLIADDAAADIKKHERYVTFTKAGAPIKTHFGGVTASDSYLYIASGGEIIRIALADVFAAENGAAVEIEDSFSTGLPNAYCYIADGMLFAGEFYRPGNYETDVSHHLATPRGANHALVYAFAMDETREGGVADMVPSFVLSVCDQVQGIAVTDDAVFLSCSYGLPDSFLKIYPNPIGNAADGTFAVNGKDVPLYILEDHVGGNFRMPCMSEEICMKDGRLHILFESMSMKYRFVVHSRLPRIMSVDPAAISDIDVVERTLFGIPFSPLGL